MNKIATYLVGVALLITFSFLVFLAFTIVTGDDPESLDPDAHANFQGPFIPIQADDLFRAYKKDRKAADRNFRGKGLEISGLYMGTQGEFSQRANVDRIIQVEKVINSRGIRRAVFLTDELGVICLVPEKNAMGFVNLTGKVITLQGVCAGMRSEADPQNGSHIYITGCRVVRK